MLMCLLNVADDASSQDDDAAMEWLCWLVDCE